MLLLFCKISTNNCSHDQTNSLSIRSGQLFTDLNNNKIDTLSKSIESDEKNIDKVSNSIYVIIIL